MNAAFSAFDDKMTSSGIPARNPAFARELSKARERFLDLTRSIAVEAGSEQEEEEPSSGTTSAPSYRLPETQLVGASSGLTVPQMPQQTSSQMVPDPLEQFSPFDLSQMPFYDYQTRVPGNTTSPPQSIIQDPPETTFGEEVEDPTLQDWDPNKPMQQYRVEVPEVCPAVYEAFFESNHPLGTAKNGEQVASLEGRRRFLCHLASSSDPNEVGQLIEILRRVTCSAKTSDQWYDKNSYAVGHSTSTKSRESIMSPSSSAELGPRVNHANACPANAGTLNDMTGEFKLGNRCPLSPGSSPSSVTENHDHDTVAFRLAEQCLDDHRGLLQGPRVANNDSISSLDSSSGYVRSQGHSGANTGLWFDDRSSGSPLSPPTSSDPARFYGSSDGRERAPFHAYNGSFPLS